MVRTFELLWLFSYRDSLSSATAAARTSHYQRPVFLKRLFGAYSIAPGPSLPFQLCTLLPYHSFVSLLVFSPLASATTPAYESITHSSTINGTHAAYGKADYAPTRAYRLVSFRLVHFD